MKYPRYAKRKPSRRGVKVYDVKATIPDSPVFTCQKGKWHVDPSMTWHWSHDSDFPVGLQTKPTWIDHSGNMVFAALAFAEGSFLSVAWRDIYEKAREALQEHRDKVFEKRKKLEDEGGIFATCAHRVMAEEMRVVHLAEIDRDGERCVTHNIYCPACAKQSRRWSQCCQSDREERAWLDEGIMPGQMRRRKKK